MDRVRVDPEKRLDPHQNLEVEYNRNHQVVSYIRPEFNSPGSCVGGMREVQIVSSAKMVEDAPSLKLVSVGEKGYGIF